jgi:hypothetical protein
MGNGAVREKLDVLRRHCDRLGRDYNAIEKTTLGTVHLASGKQSPKDVIEACRSLGALGVQHCIFNMPNVHELDPLRVFGKEIIPAAKEF